MDQRGKTIVFFLQDDVPDPLVCEGSNRYIGLFDGILLATEHPPVLKYKCLFLRFSVLPLFFYRSFACLLTTVLSLPFSP